MQVLRGPQGTLFGKNNTGGAIVVNTVKPGPEDEAYLEATVGNIGNRELSFTANQAITDNFFTRFTLAGKDTEGYTTNVVDGTNWNNDDRLLGIFQARWEPTDDLTTDLFLSHSRAKQKPRGMKCDQYDNLNYKAESLEAVWDQYSNVSVKEACEASGQDLPYDEFESEMAGNSDIFNQAVYEVEASTIAGTVAWALNDHQTLKSITAYRNTQQTADEDIDGMGIALTGRYAPEANNTDQWSQEFQLNGDAFASRLNYTVGLYAFYEKTKCDWLQDYAGFNTDLKDIQSDNTVLLAQSKLHARDTQNEAYAAFTQLSYDITDNWEFTAGIRYTWEKRQTTYREASVYLDSIGYGNYTGSGGLNDVLHYFDAPGVRSFSEWQYGCNADGGLVTADQVGTDCTAKDSRTDDAWTPMASIQYTFNDSVLDTLNLDDGMAYFTYSTGFRSGGVVVAPGSFDEGSKINSVTQSKPEYVYNYEIGAKLDAFDRRVRANLAAYYMDYKDIQLTTVVPDQANFNIPLPSIENAGKAEIYGFEAEVTFLPTDQWRFTSSLAYTHAEYKDYTVQVAAEGEGTVTLNRKDEPMPRTPEWTAFLAADYFIQTETLGTIIPTVMARYSSKIYHGFDRESFLVEDELTAPEVVFYDARLSWELPDDRTIFTLWGKNLSNEKEYLVGGIPLVGVARTAGKVYAEPRTSGLDFEYSFY